MDEKYRVVLGAYHWGYRERHLGTDHRKKGKEKHHCHHQSRKQHLHGGKEFVTIPPSNISFSVSHFVRDHQEWIPTEFSIDVTPTPSSGTNPIELHLTLSANEIHHTRILAVHYWRYHVKTNGTLSIGSVNETFHDKMQIIELLSFKTLKEKE